MQFDLDMNIQRTFDLQNFFKKKNSNILKNLNIPDQTLRSLELVKLTKEKWQVLRHILISKYFNENFHVNVKASLVLILNFKGNEWNRRINNLFIGIFMGKTSFEECDVLTWH